MGNGASRKPALETGSWPLQKLLANQPPIDSLAEEAESAGFRVCNVYGEAAGSIYMTNPKPWLFYWKNNKIYMSHTSYFCKIPNFCNKHSIYFVIVTETQKNTKEVCSI